MTLVPYRIETERLVIRCWETGDAPLRRDAIDASLENLRRWLSWAHEEPQSATATVETIRRFRDLFDTSTDYMYGVFSADERRALGSLGLHPRVGPGALEFGGWLRSDAAGKGFLAAEMVAAITRAALAATDVDRVEGYVDPDNLAVCRLLPLLGYREEARARERLLPLGSTGLRRDAVVFSMTADEFARSRARARSEGVRMLDADGAIVRTPDAD